MSVKASDVLISVGGHLITTSDSLEELKARLYIIASAWNIAIESTIDGRQLLQEFLDLRKPDAPEASSIDSMEFEMRRIMKEKATNYPKLLRKIVAVDATQKADKSYTIRARFEPE